MAVLWLFILWTWGLTPLWVNIIGTVILSINILATMGEGLDKPREDKVPQEDCDCEGDQKRNNRCGF